MNVLSLTWVLILVLVALLVVSTYTDKQMTGWIVGVALLLGVIAGFNAVFFLAKVAWTTAKWLIILGLLVFFALLATGFYKVMERK